MRRYSFIIISLLFSNHFSYSQNLEVGIGLGISQYKGDLNPNFNPLLSRPGGQLMLRYNINYAFSVRADASAMMLSGNDKLSRNPLNKSREWKFDSFLNDWGVAMEYNFLNFRSYGTIYKSDWTPLLFLGVSQYRIPIRTYESQGGSTSGYISDSPNISMTYGFGFKKQLNQNWNLSCTFTTHHLFNNEYNDNLDGTGFTHLDEPFSNYLNSSSLPANINSPNTKTKDKYFYTGITLSYVLYGVKCPSPKR